MMTDQQSTPIESQEEAIQPDGIEASVTSEQVDAASPDTENTAPGEAEASADAAAGSAPTEPTPDADKPESATPAPDPTPEPEAQPEPVVAEAPAPQPDPDPAPVEAAPEVVAEAAPAPAPAPAAPAKPAVPGMSDADLFEAAMNALETGEDSGEVEGTFKRLTKGERLEATVIQVERDRVFVDLGTKSEGIVPIAELLDDHTGDATQHIKVGDKIDVIVLKPEGADGNAIVSKKKADFENAWYDIEDKHTSGTTINAPVVDRVKGGLVVDIGVRGFVPATHVGNGKLRNIDKFVGETLPFKIIEIDRERKKVVLSNRLAEEENKAAAKDELFSSVKAADILEGTVRRLTDYGAFVDLGGVDGLLHISEMSWMRINHPKEMFKEGQKIQVMVLKLDANSGKISLGHRQVLPDPWNLIKDKYVQGQKLTVTIGRIVQSGAFVKLPEGAEAFLPLSEMSVRRIKRAQEAVEENQEVEVQIIDLRPSDRRMVLSIRALLPGGQAAIDRGGYAGPMYEDDRGRRAGGPMGGKKGGKKGKGGRRDDEDVDDYFSRPRQFGGSGVTIGERLGMLKGLLTRDEEVEEEIGETPIPEIESSAMDVAPAAEVETPVIEVEAPAAETEKPVAEEPTPEEPAAEEKKED
ncbi:MAG: S1 RNA-binding domain-containing protein [Fimbriimonadaceae bacterium]|nr:S1 RNA-binding domain-containing protein [Fimbriimonadaceae bacterium]